jgi:hypothetical protein
VSNHQQIHGGGKLIGSLIGDLPTIYDKSPVIAGIIGFCFGGLGLGLYFQSWKDFVYPLVIFFLSVLIMGSVVLPVIGVLPGWLLGAILSAGWGVWRANGGGG